MPRPAEAEPHRHTHRAALAPAARARRRSSSDVGPIEALSLELRTTPPIFVEGEVERVARRVPVIRVRLGRDLVNGPAVLAQRSGDVVEPLGIDAEVGRAHTRARAHVDQTVAQRELQVLEYRLGSG